MVQKLALGLDIVIVLIQLVVRLTVRKYVL